VVTPEPVPFAKVVGEKVGDTLRRRHEKDGVTFVCGASVKQIDGSPGAKSVTLSDGKRLEADFVVSGIGVRPVVEYLQGSGIAEDGAVPVDTRLRTKQADVFAAGDIAVVPDQMTGTAVRMEHWVVAERQGQHAARAMLGSDAPYAHVPFFWTRQTGVSLKYVGHAPTWDQTAVRGDIEAGKFVTGYYKAGNLLAAAAMGMPNEITAIRIMMEKKKALPPEMLSDGSVDLLALAEA